MRRLTQPRVSCYYSPRRSPGPPPSPRVPLLSTARAKVPSFRASARGPRGLILTPVCSSDGPGPDFDYCFSGSHALSSIAKDRVMTDRGGGSSGTPGARRALSVSLLAKVDGRHLARVARNRERRIDPDSRRSQLRLALSLAASSERSQSPGNPANVFSCLCSTRACRARRLAVARAVRSVSTARRMCRRTLRRGVLAYRMLLATARESGYLLFIAARDKEEHVAIAVSPSELGIDSTR